MSSKSRAINAILAHNWQVNLCKCLLAVSIQLCEKDSCLAHSTGLQSSNLHPSLSDPKACAFHHYALVPSLVLENRIDLLENKNSSKNLKSTMSKTNVWLKCHC